MAKYIHQHPEFRELLGILADETGIQATLIEKDYWIMHVLHGLKLQGYDFELKGGTSLSKGYKIIERFSEDIDIHIKPPEDQKVNENPKMLNRAILPPVRFFTTGWLTILRSMVLFGWSVIQTSIIQSLTPVEACASFTTILSIRWKASKKEFCWKPGLTGFDPTKN